MNKRGRVHFLVFPMRDLFLMGSNIEILYGLIRRPMSWWKWQTSSTQNASDFSLSGIPMHQDSQFRSE